METDLVATQFFRSRHPKVVGSHLITALDAELIGKVAHLTKSKPGFVVRRGAIR
jgi:hypothetical protein